MRPRISRTVGGIRFWLRSRTLTRRHLVSSATRATGLRPAGHPARPTGAADTRSEHPQHPPDRHHLSAPRRPPHALSRRRRPRRQVCAMQRAEAMDAGTTRSMRSLRTAGGPRMSCFSRRKPPSGTGCAAGRRNRRVLGQLLGSRPGLLRTRSRSKVWSVERSFSSSMTRELPIGHERLYVGLSRARDQLVVCGDPISSLGSAALQRPPVGHRRR